jgi:methylenetetrahydrofolate dehydrogenase (NADP+)/methenyltetrahydrofolate cyclohydrolase
MIIDGKEIARELRNQIASEIRQKNLAAGLAVVLVGDNPASQVYVRNKIKACEEVGITSIEHRLSADATEVEVLSLIDKLNHDKQVDGILVQLPLPRQIAESKVIEAIAPEKDVDGFHPSNVGRFHAGQPCFVPCTPRGSLILIKKIWPDLTGKKALVVGRSAIVGKPMAQLLLSENATVTIAHSRTANLAEECARADILVAAVGKPEMIKGAWIKPGAVVIDVGINRVALSDGKTKLVGDVEFAEAEKRAFAITPVPGGVGPMTIACLLQNTFEAALRRKG